MAVSTGATKWTASIAVTAALIFVAVFLASRDDSVSLIRGNSATQSITVTFTEGTSGSWIVPAGVTSVSATAVGSKGFGAGGGPGAVISASIPVAPGEELDIRVARSDTGGCTWLAARNSPNDFKILAGGGGGAGRSTPFAEGGNGGAAGLAGGVAMDGSAASRGRRYTFSGRVVQASHSSGQWNVTVRELMAPVPTLPLASGGAGARGDRVWNYPGAGSIATGRVGGLGGSGQPTEIADSFLIGLTGRNGVQTSQPELNREAASSILGMDIPAGSTETITLKTISYNPASLPAGGSGGLGGCGYAGGQGGGGGTLGGGGGGGGGGSSFVSNSATAVTSVLARQGQVPELIIAYRGTPPATFVDTTATSSPRDPSTTGGPPPPTELVIGSHSLRSIASIAASTSVRSVSIAKSSSKICRVRRETLTIVRKGKCSITIVTAANGKQSKRLLTFQVR